MIDLGPVAIGFGRPVLLALVLPLLVLFALQFVRAGAAQGAVGASGLEFLRRHAGLSSSRRRLARTALWVVTAIALVALWAEPTLETEEPLFASDSAGHKNILLMMDISRSMGVPIGIEKNRRLPGQLPQRAAAEVDEETSRYAAARAALETFVDRFQGERIGLILFSTEPFLARWPGTETAGRFREVLHENIGRGEVTQLQGFSSLTNINRALYLARDVFHRQQDVTGGAIVMITDAEDDLDTMGTAVRNLREDGIRIYVIGVGVSDEVLTALRDDFATDPGFRLFRADSPTEIEEAYQLVALLEEAPTAPVDRGSYTNDLRPLLAVLVFAAGAALVALGETRLHRFGTGGS